MWTVCDTSAPESRVPGVAKAGATAPFLGTELAVRVHNLATAANAVGALATIRTLGHNGLVQQRTVHRFRENVVANLNGCDDLSGHIFRLKFHDERFQIPLSVFAD